MLKGIHKVKKTLASGKIKTFHYAWRGGPRLYENPGTNEFIAEYASHKRDLINDGVQTLSDLILNYRNSPDFAKLAGSTRRDHEYAFKLINKGFPDLPIHLIDQKGMKREIREWRNQFADKPRTADKLIQSFKRVLSHAASDEYIKSNPATGIKRLWSGSRKNSIWTTEQIEIMRQQAPEPIVRAMLLAFYTGQRQGDLLRLKWSDYDGLHFTFEQSKSGKRIKVLVHPALKTYIDNLDKTAIRILTNTRGKPWTRDGFQTSWGKARKKAGIDGLTFHDLRGTFITERRREGSTTEQIASISGHSLTEVNRVLECHYLADDQQTSDAVILRMN